IRYSGYGAQTGSIELQKVSYVTVQNLTFDGAGVFTSAYALLVHSSVSLTDGVDMHGIQVLGNTFKNWGGSAADGSSEVSRAALGLNGGFCSPQTCPASVIGAIVRNNTFDSNRHNHMLMNHARDTLVENNQFIHAMCARGVDTSTNTIGIWIMGDGTLNP